MSEDRPSVGFNRTAIYEFLKPINAVSLLLGIIGLFLAWYFYHKSEHIPEVSWAMQRQIIFDSRSATPEIVVSDPSGQRITSDLYAAQIIVWNSGNFRLDRVDDNTLIRQPLVFSIEGTGRIVNASIVNSKDTTGSALEITKTERDVEVKWKHFDTGSAFRMLILFTGNAQTSINPRMEISGGKPMRLATYPAEARKEDNSSDWVFGLLFGIAILAAASLSAAQQVNKLIYPRLSEYNLEPATKLAAIIAVDVVVAGLVRGGIVFGLYAIAWILIGSFFTPIPRV